MFEKASSVYSKNIRTLSIVALAQVFLGTIYYLVIKFLGGATEIYKTHNLIGGTTINFDDTVAVYRNGSGSIILLGLIALIIGPMIACYVNVVIRKILKDEEINHKESFKEGLPFYWRYVGISILIVLIIAATSLCLGLIGMMFSVIPILNIIVVIAMFIGIICASIILIPCTHVMIYDDLAISEAFSRGTDIGKNHFWGIVGVGILTGIISSIVDLVGGAFDFILVFMIVTFINLMIENFLIMYYMVLCKEESI